MFVSVKYKYEATVHETLDSGFSQKQLVAQPVFNLKNINLICV